MRVSVNPEDPGYPNWMRREPGTAFHVQLDGKLIEKVITADEEQGMVIVSKVDNNGDVIVNRQLETIERETLHGVVQIIRTPRETPGGTA